MKMMTRTNESEGLLRKISTSVSKSRNAGRALDSSEFECNTNAL
jgi:hypothetical protein